MNELLSFCPDPGALSSCLTQALRNLLLVLRPADYTITKSQTDGGWKGPLKIIWSSPPPTQAGPLKAPRPDSFWRLHPGQPVPVLRHPHSDQVFPALQTELRITSSRWTKLSSRLIPSGFAAPAEPQSTTQRQTCMLLAQGFLLHIPQSVPPCSVQAGSVLPAPEKLSKSRSGMTQ